MADHELNPGYWRDIQVLRAQGVLAEVHLVDLDEADQGLRAYADATGIPLHDVARAPAEVNVAVSEPVVADLPRRCARLAGLSAAGDRAP